VTMKSMDRNKIFLPTIPFKSLFTRLLFVLTVFLLSCSQGDSEETQIKAEVTVEAATGQDNAPQASNSVEAAAEVKTLRIGVGRHLIETKALISDPNFQRLIWSGLLRLGPDGKLYPDMAAFVPELENEGISSDFKTYTFSLRKNAKWTDGGPVQAAQFLTLMFLEGESTDSRLRDEFIEKLDVDKSTSLDAQTLVFSLQESYPEFLTLMTLPAMFPDRDIQVDSLGTAPTNGPYRISEWTEERVVLIANEAWEDTVGNFSSHQIERIEFIPFSEFGEAHKKFLEGFIDILPMTSQHRKGVNLSSDDSFPVRRDPPSVYSIFINHSDEIFEDVAARRALAMNLSREDLLIDIQPDRSSSLEPAYSWIPRYVWGNSEENFISLASTDLLAADSWYVGGGTDGISLELLYSSDDPIQKALAPLLEGHWEEHLPVDVLLREERSEEHYADIVSGAYQLTLAKWDEELFDPTYWLSDFQTSAADNFTRFSEPQFDEFIELGLSARTQQDWRDNMQQASNMLMEEIVVIPMFNGSKKVLVRDENVPVVETMLSHWNWDSLVIKD